MFDRLQALLTCDRGVTVIIFALTLIPLLLIGGMAVDYTKANEIKAELQDRMDAAVLAGSSAKDAGKPEERLKIAGEHFYASLSPQLAELAKQVSFELINNETAIKGTLVTHVPTRLMSIFGWQYANVHITSVATFALPNRQLDMVFCIDATGSMQETIDSVRNNARSLEQNINAELKDRGLPEFDAIRARVIFYRDFGVDLGNQDDYQPGTWDDQNYITNQPAMRKSKGGQFYVLPDEREKLHRFLEDEKAFGGGDEPESGFLCLNDAMRSKWAKRKDRLANDSSKEITSVVPMIVVWTDANVLPLNDEWSEENPHYPRNAPRNMSELQALWNAEDIDQKNKLLVFFGNTNNASKMIPPKLRPWLRDPDPVPRWKEIESWEKYHWGGSLTDANKDLVTKLVDALDTSPGMPRLTQ